MEEPKSPDIGEPVPAKEQGGQHEQTAESKPPETGQHVTPARETKPRTCLDCGFLTIEGRELWQADRDELGTYRHTNRGVYWESGVMPAHPERTQCFKHLWVGYDLTYIDYSADGVVDELERPRGECFFPYQEGFTPEEHRQFLIRTPDFLAKMPTSHDEKAIADTINKEATEDSHPIPDADSRVVVVNKETADITIAHNMPTKETPAPARAIELDSNRRRIRIDAVWYDLTPKRYKILETLYNANGAWVSGKILDPKSRIDKIIKKMPPAVSDLINSSPQGYRILLP